MEASMSWRSPRAIRHRAHLSHESWPARFTHFALALEHVVPGYKIRNRQQLLLLASISDRRACSRHDRSIAAESTARNTYTISALQTCSPCRRPDENQPPLLPARTGPPFCSDLIVKGKDCLFASRNCEERQEVCRYSPLPVLRSSPLPYYWLVRFTRAQECRHVLVPEPLAILRFRVRFFITQQKNNVLITGLSTRGFQCSYIR